MCGNILYKTAIIASILFLAVTLPGCNEEVEVDSSGETVVIDSTTSEIATSTSTVEILDDLDNDGNGLIDEGLERNYNLFTDVLACAESDYQPWRPSIYENESAYQLYIYNADVDDLDGDGNTEEDIYFSLSSYWTVSPSDKPDFLEHHNNNIDFYFTGYIDEGYNAIKFDHITDPTSLHYDWTSDDKPDELTQNFWVNYYDKLDIYQLNPNPGTCYHNTENETAIILLVAYPMADAKEQMEDLVSGYTDTIFKLTNGWYYDKNNYQNLFIKKMDDENEGLMSIFDALTEGSAFSW